MEYYEFRAMNSEIAFAAEADTKAGRGGLREGFDQARAFIEASEARFTRFVDTSELSALNRASSEWVSVSSELYEVVREAREYVEETGGLFDPSILGALERAGYDKSMDEIRREGASAPRSAADTHAIDIRGMQFDATLSGIRLPHGLRLDLGGIAKGWIAERAARILAGFASACAVSAGGDMFLTGTPEGESAWEVALEDPRDPNQTLTVLRVAPGAVATSSIARRTWQQGERSMHHLIDPRTQLPAETDWLSVTVIAPHTTTAEVYAKALLIAGPREAEQIAARRGDISFVAVDTDGRLWSPSKRKEPKGREIEYT